MSISVVGYTEDHFNPSAILNDLHAHAAVELWVGTCDPALSPSERNGAANAPFANIAEAMTYIATRPETAFVVHLAPESWSDATLVAGKYIVLEGPMRGMCSLSTITIPSSPTTTALFMRNCNVLSLEFSGTAGESAIALLENTNVTSGISNPNNIQCQVLMKAFRDSESSIGSSTVAGPINLGSQGTFDAGGVFLGGKLTVQKFRLVDSILPTEIEVINGLDSVVERSEWQHTNPTITHTGSSANVHFDAYSAKSFGLQSGSILNGGVIQGEEGPYLLQADSTFSAFQLAAPALLAGHVQLASATPDVATLGVVYPAVASGALALVWPSGTRIPASPVSGAGSYYRDSTTGSASLASSTQPIGNSDGSLFYVEISSLNANSTLPISAYASSLIYKPGGVSTGITYATWSELYAAFQSTDGLVNVLVDSSLAVPTVPAGTYDFQYRAKFTARTAQGALVFQEGSLCKNIREISGAFTFDTQATTTPPLQFDPAPASPVFFINDGAIVMADSGLTPLIFVQDSTTLTVFLSSVASLGTLNTNTPTFKLGSDASLLVFASGQSHIYENLLQGPSNSAVQIIYDASSTYAPSHPLFLGTLTATPAGLAANCIYTPVTPANWSPAPTLTNTALDQLASRLSAFTQGSVLFAGASGVYSQNNSKLFWDNTNFRLGIGTATPAVELDNVGFTKLGSLSPSLKVYYATGTTNASQGGQSSINLDASIASSKIISVSVMVEYSTGSYVGPGSVSSSGQQFDWSINSGSPVSLSINNVTGNSAGILSKPFRAVIVYIA